MNFEGQKESEMATNAIKFYGGVVFHPMNFNKEIIEKVYEAFVRKWNKRRKKKPTKQFF